MRSIFFAVMCLFLAACSPDAERAKAPVAAGDEVQVVNGLMAAFNDHDADKMRSYWHDDVTWVEITGNQSSVVTASAEQLYNELIAYNPSVSSSLESITVNGKYVSAVEARTGPNGKAKLPMLCMKSLTARSKGFWYFPPSRLLNYVCCWLQFWQL